MTTSKRWNDDSWLVSITPDWNIDAKTGEVIDKEATWIKNCPDEVSAELEAARIEAEGLGGIKLHVLHVGSLASLRAYASYQAEIDVV